MIEPPQPFDILTIHGYSLTSVTTPLTILVCCLWATPQLHVELVEVVLVEGCEVVETSSEADTTHLDKNNKYTF